jgi:hypothetical protein
LAQTVMELDGVALDGESSGGQERGRVESERQKQCRRRRGKWREFSSAPDKGRPGMGNDGDWRLRALYRGHGHHAVTRLVVTGVGTVTSACG